MTTIPIINVTTIVPFQPPVELAKTPKVDPPKKSGITLGIAMTGDPNKNSNPTPTNWPKVVDKKPIIAAVGAYDQNIGVSTAAIAPGTKRSEKPLNAGINSFKNILTPDSNTYTPTAILNPWLRPYKIQLVPPE